MNKIRMEKLAAYIETRPPENFNMSSWIAVYKDGAILPTPDDVCTVGEVKSQCGTACCIAGWQVIKNRLCLSNQGGVYRKKGKKGKVYIGNAENYVRDYLGLSYCLAYDLFRKTNWPSQFRYSPDTPQNAAARIRFMIEEGR